MKPRDGAGASGASRIESDRELEPALRALGPGRSIAVEEFIEGHEGFFDTLTVRGQVVHEFATHYYPNVLEAMRTRWISPQFIATNRIDAVGAYDEVKAMGQKVIETLGVRLALRALPAAHAAALVLHAQRMVDDEQHRAPRLRSEERRVGKECYPV